MSPNVQAFLPNCFGLGSPTFALIIHDSKHQGRILFLSLPPRKGKTNKQKPFPSGLLGGLPLPLIQFQGNNFHEGQKFNILFSGSFRSFGYQQQKVI